MYHNSTQKINNMFVISSREFRENQRVYFEKADNGEQIIVQRGKDKAYIITSVKKEDVYFNAQMVAHIKESMQQVKEGKVTKIATPKDVSNLLGL